MYAFFVFTATRCKRRSDAKKTQKNKREAVEHNLMHGRKRVKLFSTAFGRKKYKIIDIEDVYRAVSEIMDVKDQIVESLKDALQTPEPDTQRTKKQIPGQSNVT